MVKNHFKNSNRQIRIRIFTKIESIWRSHTPNLSTKFHPNPSTTFWDIVLYISLARSMVRNHLKNYQIWIRIRIFTKIESFLSCHKPNMSTKFRPNPSTTFWDIVLYILFGPISQWWRITLTILVVGSGSGSRSLPKSNRFVLVTHRTCPPNFIQIRPHLFEISCTQTNTKRGENITSFTFGGGSN